MKSSTLRKPPTLLDVARVSGLSKSTVSAALNGQSRHSEATRQTVLKVAQELGYEANYHAQGLRKQSNDLIGFFSPDMDLGISTLKMHRIWGLLDARGYTVPVLAYGNRLGGQVIEQEKLLAELRRQKPRAMICNTSNLQSEAAQAELRRYLEEGGQAVCYDWPLEVETDRVIFDREHNTYLATRHLLEKGHRKIGACLPWHKYSSGPRAQGFKKALAEFEAETREEWILKPDFKFQFELEGADLAAKFLSLRERPTAMCVVNDYVASAFATCLARAGVQVPRDLSIVSHDNSPIAEIGPTPLTSISHPIEEIAETVVEMLDSRLTGRYDGPARCEIIRGQLFDRGSVVAPSQ